MAVGSLAGMTQCVGVSCGFDPIRTVNLPHSVETVQPIRWQRFTPRLSVAL